jgi:UDP:flavonoid glycosyltransferase YjiC (YdhE family)
MGKRIVITSFGSFGDIFPYLGLARRLTQRGYDPVVATSAHYRPLIEGAGVAFCPVRPDIDPEDHALVRRVMEPTRGAALLVTHPITFAGPLVAERYQIPWVSTVLAPVSFFSAYYLPVVPSLPRLVRLRRLGPGVSRGLIHLAKWATRRWTEPIRQLRADLGLPPGANPLFEGQFSPGLTLALFSRLLANPQPDWPPHTQVTGFIDYQGPNRLPPAVVQFLEAGPAPLVFTLGSSAVCAAGPFYQESLEAVPRLGHRAVLLVGTDPQNHLPEPLPAGVLAVPYAPHGDLFPRALAIVHQGGIGTTGQALRAGRPMLVVPYAFDRPDNAWRVTKLGVARTLFPKQYEATRVIEQVRALVEDPHHAQRAAEMGGLVLAEEGVQPACDALEAYLGTAPPAQAAPESRLRGHPSGRARVARSRGGAQAGSGIPTARPP